MGPMAVQVTWPSAGLALRRGGYTAAQMRRVSVEIQSTLRSLRQRLGTPASSLNADISHIRHRILHSIRVSKALFRATRDVMKTVGLLESNSDLLYVPGILFWIVWWAIFAVVLFLPTY